MHHLYWWESPAGNRKNAIACKRKWIVVYRVGRAGWFKDKLRKGIAL